jgi:hypothetical protein
MEECKHGLRSGCSYCHSPIPTVVKQTAQPKKRVRAGSVPDKMNERMTGLKRRLKPIRGE